MVKNGKRNILKKSQVFKILKFGQAIKNVCVRKNFQEKVSQLLALHYKVSRKVQLIKLKISLTHTHTGYRKGYFLYVFTHKNKNRFFFLILRHDKAIQEEKCVC